MKKYKAMFTVICDKWEMDSNSKFSEYNEEKDDNEIFLTAFCNRAQAKRFITEAMEDSSPGIRRKDFRIVNIWIPCD